MASFMKKIFVSTTLVLAAVATNVQAKDWKVIRFGTESSYAPFEYKTPDGKLTGFDVDLGNAICAKLKAKCVWVENSFDGMIPALKAKKFDGILSSMTVTDAARPKYELYIHDQFLYHRQIHISGRKVKLYRQVMDSLQKVQRPNQQTLLL